LEVLDTIQGLLLAMRKKNPGRPGARPYFTIICNSQGDIKVHNDSNIKDHMCFRHKIPHLFGYPYLVDLQQEEVVRIVLR